MKLPLLLSKEQIEKIEETIGYQFRNSEFLVQAFTRSSYRNEHPDQPDNEVLELIGDSVLSLTVLTDASELLLSKTETGISSRWNEGKISSLKNALVNKHALAACMRPLNLTQYLLVSEGDRKVGILEEDSVLEDLTESIFGAVYVDSGWNFSVAANVVRRVLSLPSALQNASVKKVHLSYRNDLQEWAQDPSRRFGVPLFTTSDENGGFCVTVSIPGLEISAKGHGKNQKIAGEEASKNMLDLLNSSNMQWKIAQAMKKNQESALPTSNDVGKLNELLQKKGAPNANFEIVSESVLEGNLHRFEVSCSCMGFITCGVGENKAAARRDAAKQMLKKVF